MATEPSQDPTPAPQMPIKGPPRSLKHIFVTNGDSGSDSDCSIQRYEDYAVEEMWEQEPLDGSDSDVQSSINTSRFMYVGPRVDSCGLSPPIPQVEGCTEQDQHAIVDNFDAEGRDNDVTMHSLQRKRWRPCKARRKKFQKFIDYLKAKVRQEPVDFDIDSVQLPKGMTADHQTLARVRSMMEQYQREVLQGVLPNLDAITCNKSLRKSQGVPLHLAMFLSH